MTRHVYAWIFQTLAECPLFLELVDPLVPTATAGLRRMDRANPGKYQRCVCFGRLTRGPLTGYETRPLWNVTVTFSIWVRPDLDPNGNTVSGDLLLEDIEDAILRALVVRPGATIPGQDCRFPNRPPIIVLDSRFDGDATEPEFDDFQQAWTKSFRIRTIVSVASCQPVLPWCGPCAEAEAAATA